ncbi:MULTISPECIES: VRR-NUC domain-containing protein [Myxococcus]|uniref:VRR-NUC domain-containing protein n=1 Tax=Myxococcus xanthus TaxID=34 RepID=A0AAE6FW09_MYXXA|nr:MULTISPECIES: VRR-NUC domain-containing protein [Myxococcus]QDE65954.1 hypothetical protein BHS09_02460 [Myxococcus xanthus]QDE73226.1 hypothetical protein BHS08_02460 [Myxococcus xanthus]QDE80498.1 hypothetical protein BHS07_02390 [Myxococcus xanthus]QDE94814.1 hypothetical protein BHS05_02425 [Myxococcus xanthus]WAM26997.1 VRR-NUC domain-containing protein [Myxococcus sp. NMCA1]
MSRCNRYALARDANEGPIVERIRLAGWFVLRLNGAGLPDLLCVRGGRVVFIEVKAAKGGRMKPAQVELHAQLSAAGLTIAIATTPEEALAALDGTVVRTVQDVRAEKRRGATSVRALATAASYRSTNTRKP